MYELAATLSELLNINMTAPKNNLIKQFVFTLLLTLATYVCFSQERDLVVLNNSEPVKLSFTTKPTISSAFLTFLKFKDGGQGIQFNMVAPSKTSAHIYVHNMDSLTLKLNNEKSIILKPYKDTVYNQMDGSNSWTSYYVIDISELRLLKTELIIEIFTREKLRLKQQTANKIGIVVNSFF